MSRVLEEEEDDMVKMKRISMLRDQMEQSKRKLLMTAGIEVFQ